MSEKKKIILVIVFSVVMFSCIIGVGVWAEHDVQYAITHGYQHVHGKDLPK